ncbi:MAG TPA: glycosyltransferase family 2 protein [Terracidiphilus sp.]|jgi:hypothetical protein|nr:glycosyltransferase family 2 protein [Terracidiphilus sp.]
MRTSIIILNWNGWKDTIECLESVFRLKTLGYRVIVCDNQSSDGSLDKIKLWANGELNAIAQNPELAHLISPPILKPIRYVELTRAETGTAHIEFDAPLILIQSGENIGFAAGNNIGINCALRDKNCEFFWILNNDTVVDPQSLDAMMHMMLERNDIGLCGSLNLSYVNPEEVQTEGGNKYSRWTGRVAKRRKYFVHNLPPRPAEFDYVNGASMLASRDFLEKVGLMEESYFLYFEEMDWAMRAKGQFTLGYARESVIYHKEGKAIGSNGDRMSRSLRSEYYLTKNRVLFTRRFFPWALPTVIAAIGAAALERICRGDWNRGRTMFTAMAAGMNVHRIP